MKKMMIAGMMLATMMAGVAMAEDTLTSSSSGEMGEFTSSNPTGARLATAPLRAVTGGVGAGAGLVGGAAKGFVTGLQDANDFSAKMNGQDTDDTAMRVMHSVLYLPTAVAASAVYVPVNMVGEGLKNMFEFGSKGCTYWDRL
ncbi:MAG: hypothetical protein AB7P76_09810 [Candidatus Melainabacteria bacterium]